MARLDVYPMPGRGAPGYVVDVRARLLDHLATRAVVPLLAVADAPPPIKELNPVFDIEDAAYVMLTQAIATVFRTRNSSGPLHPWTARMIRSPGRSMCCCSASDKPYGIARAPGAARQACGGGR
jgi:toxin CcdB